MARRNALLQLCGWDGIFYERRGLRAGKAGGLTISEALECGLLLILVMADDFCSPN